MIIDHTHPEYIKKYDALAVGNRHNGALYYSKEIVKNIIPRVKTERPWVTLKAGENAADHAVVFVHNNDHPEWYNYLKEFKDLVLVCGVPTTCDKIKHLGRPIYIPLSVDVAEVEKYRKEKTKGRAFVGRRSKRRGSAFPPYTDIIEGLPREDLLERMAEYKEVYAVGRTAIEARILGCDILAYDTRYPDPEVWKIVDNKEAAKILQQKLDEIDK